MRKRLALIVAVGTLAACGSNPPPPDWQLNAKAASERSTAAYLTGNARIDAAELARARAEVARTGRADLLARIELAHCAAQVASLVFDACAGFEALRADAPAPERVYADYIAGRVASGDVGLLPAAHRAVAINPTTLGGRQRPAVAPGRRGRAVRDEPFRPDGHSSCDRHRVSARLAPAIACLAEPAARARGVGGSEQRRAGTAAAHRDRRARCGAVDRCLRREPFARVRQPIGV